MTNDRRVLHRWPVSWRVTFLRALPASIYDRYWLVRSLAHRGRFDEAAQYAAEALRLAEPTQRASTVGLAHFAAGRLLPNFVASRAEPACAEIHGEETFRY